MADMEKFLKKQVDAIGDALTSAEAAVEMLKLIDAPKLRANTLLILSQCVVTLESVVPGVLTIVSRQLEGNARKHCMDTEESCRANIVMLFMLCSMSDKVDVQECIGILIDNMIDNEVFATKMLAKTLYTLAASVDGKRLLSSFQEAVRQSERCEEIKEGIDMAVKYAVNFDKFFIDRFIEHAQEGGKMSASQLGEDVSAKDIVFGPLLPECFAAS